MNSAPQATIDALAAQVAFPNRLGDPSEYAAMAVELCRNTYMNAHVLRIDGGVRFSAK